MPKPSRLGSCLRKRAYAVLAFAEKVAAKRLKRSGLKLTVYRCLYCRQYHLTHHPMQEDQ